MRTAAMGFAFILSQAVAFGDVRHSTPPAPPRSSYQTGYDQALSGERFFIEVETLNPDHPNSPVHPDRKYCSQAVAGRDRDACRMGYEKGFREFATLLGKLLTLPPEISESLPEVRKLKLDRNRCVMEFRQGMGAGAESCRSCKDLTAVRITYLGCYTLGFSRGVATHCEGKQARDNQEFLSHLSPAINTLPEMGKSAGKGLNAEAVESSEYSDLPESQMSRKRTGSGVAR